MPYITKNQDGHIVGIFACAQYDGQEVVETAELWTPPPTIQDQIVALESANPITHRNLRNLSMAVAQLAEVVTGQPASNLPMVQVITALEQQIAELRASL